LVEENRQPCAFPVHDWTDQRHAIPAVGQPSCKAAKISKIFQISLRSLPIVLLETYFFSVQHLRYPKLNQLHHLQDTLVLRTSVLFLLDSHRTFCGKRQSRKMGDVAQVKVVFTTTEQDIVLPESKQQLLVPAGKS
jgi:hypothetical protein